MKYTKENINLNFFNLGKPESFDSRLRIPVAHQRLRLRLAPYYIIYKQALICK